jgi:hypothetical protein
MTRDEAIGAIRASLKQRSGKVWSVKGGRGTAWGWITIDAPPARRTWGHVLPAGLPDYPESYVEQDLGTPDHHMGPAERAELGRLLGLDRPVHSYESIPASSAYYAEYVDRAAGRTPAKLGTQYWD